MTRAEGNVIRSACLAAAVLRVAFMRMDERREPRVQIQESAALRGLIAAVEALPPAGADDIENSPKQARDEAEKEAPKSGDGREVIWWTPVSVEGVSSLLEDGDSALGREESAR